MQLPLSAAKKRGRRAARRDGHSAAAAICTVRIRPQSPRPKRPSVVRTLSPIPSGTSIAVRAGRLARAVGATSPLRTQTPRHSLRSRVAVRLAATARSLSRSSVVRRRTRPTKGSASCRTKGKNVLPSARYYPGIRKTPRSFGSRRCFVSISIVISIWIIFPLTC